MICIASSQSQVAAMGLADILKERGMRHQLIEVFEDLSAMY